MQPGGGTSLELRSRGKAVWARQELVFRKAAAVLGWGSLL